MIFIWILKIIIIIIIISIDKMSILTILNSQSNQIHDIPTHKLNTPLLVYYLLKINYCKSKNWIVIMLKFIFKIINSIFQRKLKEN